MNKQTIHQSTALAKAMGAKARPVGMPRPSRRLQYKRDWRAARLVGWIVLSGAASYAIGWAFYWAVVG